MTNITDGTKVVLNDHLLMKMEQSQRNMMAYVRERRRRTHRARYWARQFSKWSSLLIERAIVIETKPL